MPVGYCQKGPSQTPLWPCLPAETRPQHLYGFCDPAASTAQFQVCPFSQKTALSTRTLETPWYQVSKQCWFACSCTRARFEAKRGKLQSMSEAERRAGLPLPVIAYTGTTQGQVAKQKALIPLSPPRSLVRVVSMGQMGGRTKKDLHLWLLDWNACEL